MKFSIRDLILVTLVVALAVGWWVDRVRLVVQHEAAIEQERNARQLAIRFEEDFANIKERLRLKGWTVKRSAQGTISGIEPTLPNSSAPAPIPPKP